MMNLHEGVVIAFIVQQVVLHMNVLIINKL